MQENNIILGLAKVWRIAYTFFNETQNKDL